MKEITVTAERSYNVQFVGDYRAALKDLSSDQPVVILVPTVLRYLVQELPKSWLIIELPDGEAQKTLSSYGAVLEQMSAASFPRNGVVVGIGGGATTDLAGFVAATYMRGVNWIAVPTSLAAMVDAAVGGKTGVNLSSGKNLVGAFHSPLTVIVDTGLLETLSERDLTAGLAEVAKCGFIADAEILKLLQSDYRSNLVELIYRAIKVKSDVVSVDFKESFHREILNYGHTLGHAIEKHAQYQMRHGECVAIGLIFAAELSARVSGLPEEAVKLHYEILTTLGLPTTYVAEAWPALFNLMQSDKKKKDSDLRFVTLSGIGSPVRAEGLTEELLRDIFLSTIAEKGKQ